MPVRENGAPLSGADAFKNPVLTHLRLADRPDMRAVSIRVMGLAANQVTTMGVRDRKWITVLAISRMEPSLEIHAP